MQNPGYRRRQASRIVFLVGAGLALFACNVRDVEPFGGAWEVDQQALQAWAPDDATPNAVPGTLWTSRAWVAPNPLLIPIPASDTGWSGCAGFDAYSIGLEPVTITAMRYEGIPVETSWFQDFVGNLPYTFLDGSWGGSNGFGLGYCALPGTAPGFLGEMVWEMDDPTAPEVRVEVYAVPASEMPEPVAEPHFSHEYHSALHFYPSPVRLSWQQGATTVNVTAHRLGLEPMNLRGIGTLGPDFSVEAVDIEGVEDWDGMYPVSLPTSTLGIEARVQLHIQLSYEPTGDKPRHDALLVAFDDGGWESFRVAVPIIVR